MNQRNIFENISPLDHRYSLSAPETYKKLSAYLSEEASVKACIRAEAALVKAHLSTRGLLTPDLEKKLDKSLESVTSTAVYAEEEKTKHNVRALVNVLKEHVPQDIAPLVHLGATSVDILDTAFALRVKGCTQDVIVPLLKELEIILCDIAEKEASTPQVGRTHGQHAVPITFGFAISEYVSRLGKSILEIDRLAKNARGKLAGAVGAYNATTMITKDPEELERQYLSYLGLEASEHSTQLVEPEYILRILLEINVAFGIIANLADDLRNLQRSEINEVHEYFSSTQVGSSTMPQKRNPWNSEHVKSLWKAFAPRIMTFYMDQISEHQRDLSNSASQRFVSDYLAGFTLAAERMKSIVSGISPDPEQLLSNLSNAGGSVKGGVLAEPAYILLAESGISDAHEVIRVITLDAEKSGISFYEALKKQEEAFAKITAQLEKLNIENPADFFAYPQRYCGLASKKATELAKKYRALMS